MLTRAERLVVTEAVERTHRAGRSRAECYRAAATTLRAVFPGMATQAVAAEALAIVLEYVQSIG